jgi:DNA gyrase/topoisomerase IV subunit A
MKKRSMKSKKPRSSTIGTQGGGSVTEVYLENKACDEYYKYGIAVIEDRAIQGSIDGLKPVVRRSLWTTHQLGLTHKSKHDKSAKVVGTTLGNYHPHGDGAAYGALVNAANSPMKLIDGDGNWGTMTDPPAAYRYTNCRLSTYADLIFFDKFYLPVMDYIPNYDGSLKEPLILASLLPNAILNGNFGITPGVQTRTPSYSLESVIKVLKASIKEGSCTPEICLDLEFTSKYGGVVKKTKEVRKELLTFYKSGKGKFTFESVATEPNAKNEIRIDRFAPISSIEKTLTKVEGIKGVQATRDDSDKHDRYQKAYVITFARTLKGTLLKQTIERVMAQFATQVSFSVQATDRILTPKGDCSAKLFPSTVPDLIQRWISYRIDLEKKACTYWIEKRQLELDDLNLLRLAVKQRDLILKALSKNCTDAELVSYLAKQLKITEAQANRILDLKVRQLRALEDKKLVAQIKAIEEESAGYESRRKAPRKFILTDLDRLAKAILK